MCYIGRRRGDRDGAREKDVTILPEECAGLILSINLASECDWNIQTSINKMCERKVPR